MANLVTCKRCGCPNLYWRKSAKGKWYLVEEKSVTNANGKQSRAIPFGHRCKAQFVEEKNESYYFDHADGSFI